MSRALVLLSAGLDSVVSFKLAYDTYADIMCLTFDYGQQAHSLEVAYAQKICAMYSVGLEVVKLPWYASFVGALTDKTGIPRLSQELLEDLEATRKTARAVWVPARNVVFLSIAASFCENYDYDSIIVGFNKEEAKTFPDNSLGFIDSFNKALQYATLTEIKVSSPLIEYNKKEIVALGLRIKAPLEWSWSCYAAETVPCLVCESCLRRSRAFDAINKEDPLLKRLRDK